MQHHCFESLLQREQIWREACRVVELKYVQSNSDDYR